MRASQISPEVLRNRVEYYVGQANGILMQKGETFSLTQENITVFEELIKYFEGFTGEFDLNRSIFLNGEKGTGKSFLLELFRLSVPLGRRFKRMHAKKLASLYATGGSAAIVPFETGALLIDDIATEDVKTSFGSKENVIEYLISMRYDEWQRKGLMTHFTGNVDKKIIEDTYGERTWSRLVEMSNMQIFTGEDRRLKK